MFCHTRFPVPVTLSCSTTHFIRRSVPEPPCPLVAVRASPLRWSWGALPFASSGSASGRVFGHLALPRLTASVHSLPFGPSRRRPFGHPAALPRSECAPSPHHRRISVAGALPTRASQSRARPTPPRLLCGACSSTRGVRLRLPPHARSPLRSCAILRSLWSAHGRTSTSKIAPMLDAQIKRASPLVRGLALIAVSLP